MGHILLQQKHVGELERYFAVGERSVEPRHPKWPPSQEHTGHVVSMTMVGLRHAVVPDDLPHDDAVVLEELLRTVPRIRMRVVLRGRESRAGEE